MVFSYLVFYLAASTSLAIPIAPLPRSWGMGDVFNPATWPVPLRDFYTEIGRSLAAIHVNPSLTMCDLSQATLPSCSPTSLSAPSADLTLRHVAIGRGTQNYTCATSDASSTPVAVGAVATLFNASCIAATFPALLSLLPNLALQYSLPTTPGAALAPSNIQPSGRHFFAADGTPVFNLNTTIHAYGQVAAKKSENVPAPSGSVMGPVGQGGYGSVPWLKLVAKDVASGFLGEEKWVNGFEQVYRVNTAGGNPPAICEGMQGQFQIQYAAEYWFYD